MLRKQGHFGVKCPGGGFLRRARKEVGQTKAEAMALAGKAKRRMPTTPPNPVPRLTPYEDPCQVEGGGGVASGHL